MSNEYQEYDTSQSGRREGRGCLTLFAYFLLMVTGGIILLGLVAMIGIWRTGDRFVQGLDTMFNPPTPTPQIDIRSVVVKQIRNVSELTTSVFAMETVTEASQSKELLGFEVGQTRLLYIGYGEVRAGIDLSEIEVEDIEVMSDTIRIRIPPPRLLDNKIDVNRSRVYDYQEGFLGPNAPQLQSLAEQEALDKIILAACENGILDEANQKAQLAITQLLSVTGFNDIDVEPQSPAPNECPAP